MDDLDFTSRTWTYSKAFRVTTDGEHMGQERLYGDWLRRLYLFNREGIVRGHKWLIFDTLGIIQFNVEVDQDSVVSMLMCIYGGPINAYPLDYDALTRALVRHQRNPNLQFGFYPNLLEPDFNIFLRLGSF